MAEPSDSQADRVGSHYKGDAAADYLAYQGQIGALGADLNRWKFEPHLRPGDSIVDFGCGTGALLERLNVKSKTGVEVSEPARREAQARGLTVVASTTELADESADVVISNHALEHTLSPLDELRELRRVLRTGGRLILWLPLDDWRGQRHPLTQDPDHHLYTWTPRLLTNLLEEAGFTVASCKVVTHAWPPRAHRLTWLPRRLFDTLGRVWSVVRRRRQLAAVAYRG